MSLIDKVRVSRELSRFMISEFFGTFLLVFITLSVCANYEITDSSDKASKHLASVLGSGSAAVIALSVSMPISGGHLNPAITLGLATIGQFPWERVIPYIIAQHCGSLVAGLMVYVTFYDPIHVHVHEDGVLNSTAILESAHIFSSAPPPAHATHVGFFLTSFWASAIFLIGVATTTDSNSSMRPPKWYWPIGPALTIMTVLQAFGHNGGPSLNPAMSVGPRVIGALFGWSKVVWSGHYWWLSGVLAPHIGATVGLWTYRVLVTVHYPRDEERGLLVNCK